jgi:uncharacterized protein (TIGR03000 family)
MRKFSVLACTILGIGAVTGTAPAQGTVGPGWPGSYSGYYPFGGSWGAWTNRQEAESSRQEAAGRSAAARAAVDQSVAGARQAEAQRRANAAAGVQAAYARNAAIMQSQEDDDRARQRLARLEARHVTAERQEIAQGVTGAWTEFAYAGSKGKNLPTDMGAVELVADKPGSPPVTHAVSPAVQAARGADVRANFRQPSLFTTKWFQDHTDSWMPGKWAETGGISTSADAAWRYPNWDGLIRWTGWDMKPISFDYGINIKIEYNIVFRDEAKEATEEEYYRQAIALAQTNPPGQQPGMDWLPLGVFALVQEGQTQPSAVTHLAVNKAGMIGGNYYKPETKMNYPVRGAVDKKNQRMAGMPGGQEEIAFEVGLYNLTQDVAPILVFSGKDKTQQWLMVRLKTPEAPINIDSSSDKPSVSPEGYQKAFLEIQVPADAEIWLDGYKATQVGTVRKFSTPALKPGVPFAYDVRVRWTENGSPVEETRKVVVQAGERTRVEFPGRGS